MKERFRRLYLLYTLIADPGTPASTTRDYIAWKIMMVTGKKPSPSTLDKDIKLLKDDMGIPIRFTRGSYKVDEPVDIEKKILEYIGII